MKFGFACMSVKEREIGGKYVFRMLFVSHSLSEAFSLQFLLSQIDDSIN